MKKVRLLQNGDVKVEMVSISDLKPHPKNYRTHPLVGVGAFTLFCLLKSDTDPEWP